VYRQVNLKVEPLARESLAPSGTPAPRENMSSGSWLAAVTHVDDIVEFADSRKPVWIEVTGLTNVSTVETVGQAFDYHRLTLEDVVSDATLQDGATIIDHYFPVMETLDDHLNDVEDALLSATTADAVSLARSARLELQTLRHVVWPMREVLTSLLRDDTGVVTTTRGCISAIAPIISCNSRT
jgi:Mg2+ and Co2+ transporter CorA